MKNHIIAIILILYTFNPAHAKNIDYSKVFESSSRQFGEIVARYMFLRYSPCLHIELLSPQKNWTPIDKFSFCDYEGINFNNNTLTTTFEHISFNKQGMEMTVEIINEHHEDYRLIYCTTKFHDNKISKPNCTQTP